MIYNFELLYGWSWCIASSDIPEPLLLRDLLFTFQGIDGTYIKYHAQSDAYHIVAGVGVSKPTRLLVHRIAELGWLYRKICNYVNNTLDSPSVGLMEQAFCGALQNELNDYYRLIA